MSLTRTTAPLLGLAALAALALTGKPAAAQTITFLGLTGENGDNISSPYTEGGFTVNFTTGQWHEAHAFGNPIPSIYTAEESAVVDVTHSGGTVFTFSSVDFGNASAGSPTYTLTGLRSGATVFTSSGDFLTPYAFTTIGSPDSTSLIDDLKLTLNRGTTSSVNIDNIALNSRVTTVPEPSTVASLGLGAFGLGGLVLRARKRKVQSAS